MVGLAPGLGAVANMIFSPFGGVLADRLNRRTILIVAQLTTASAILILGILTVADVVQVWHIFLVTVVQRVTMGLQLATRNTLMYDVVGPRVFMNAMAGQFMSTHAASVLAPLAGGFLMAYYGPGYLFLAIGSIILLGTLFLLAVPSVPVARSVGSMWGNLKEGIGFVLHDRPVRTVLWTVLITDGLGFSTQAMFPVVTRDVLHAGPVVLGLLSTFRGAGGVVGSLIISSFGDIKAKGFVFIGAALIFGVFIVLFAISRSFPLSLVFILLVGAFATTYDTMAHTLLQTMTPEVMRGRVMGIYSFVVSGIGLGALGLGALTGLVGVSWALAAAGSAVASNAVVRLPMARVLSERSASRIAEALPTTKDS